jgi:hypothetical protein
MKFVKPFFYSTKGDKEANRQREEELCADLREDIFQELRWRPKLVSDIKAILKSGVLVDKVRIQYRDVWDFYLKFNEGEDFYEFLDLLEEVIDEEGL